MSKRDKQQFVSILIMERKMNHKNLKENVFKALFWTVGNVFPNKGKPLGSIGNRIRCALARGIGAKVESDVIINRHSQIQKNVILSNRASVGEFCLVQEGTVFRGRTLMAPGVHIYTENHYYDIKDHVFRGFTPINPVEIGKNVWLCRNVTICPGSKVGNNTIVAAGAVVTGEFPDGVLLGGVPAEVKKVIDIELYQNSVEKQENK